MTTPPLAPAHIVPMTRQKAMLVFCLLVLCTLGPSPSASAQESTFITFDPPGSVETIPNSMNSRGEITGYYFDGNIFHGFLRSPHGTFTTFDFPGATAHVAVNLGRTLLC